MPKELGEISRLDVSQLDVRRRRVLHESSRVRAYVDFRATYWGLR
jgi:hypothetical protein